MSRHLLALAPVVSFLMAAASLAGRWTPFILYLKHGAVASDRGRFGLYSRSIFDRRFLETTGTTPLRWVNAQRVVVAQRTLESTDLSIDEVARRSGFPSTSAMRANFLRVLGTQPSRYREAYLASRPHNSSRYSS